MPQLPPRQRPRTEPSCLAGQCSASSKPRSSAAGTAASARSKCTTPCSPSAPVSRAAASAIRCPAATSTSLRLSRHCQGYPCLKHRARRVRSADQVNPSALQPAQPATNPTTRRIDGRRLPAPATAQLHHSARAAQRRWQTWTYSIRRADAAVAGRRKAICIAFNTGTLWEASRQPDHRPLLSHASFRKRSCGHPAS